jgi:hypothetical protein
MDEYGILHLRERESPDAFFFLRGEIDAAYFSAGSRLYLVLKNIAPPSGHKARDFSNADIGVNFSVCGTREEDASLRSLFVFFLQYPQELSRYVFSAYDHKVNNEVGFSFDKEKIMQMFEAARARCPVQADGGAMLSRAQFSCVPIERVCGMLERAGVSRLDGMYYVKTDMSYPSYSSAINNDPNRIPWYVITNEDKPVPAARVQEAWIVQMLKRLFYERGQWLWKRILACAGVVVGVVLVVVLIGVLGGGKKKDDIPFFVTPAVSARTSAEATLTSTPKPTPKPTAAPSASPVPSASLETTVQTKTSVLDIPVDIPTESPAVAVDAPSSPVPTDEKPTQAPTATVSIEFDYTEYTLGTEAIPTLSFSDADYKSREILVYVKPEGSTDDFVLRAILYYDEKAPLIIHWDECGEYKLQVRMPLNSGGVPKDEITISVTKESSYEGSDRVLPSGGDALTSDSGHALVEGI